MAKVSVIIAAAGDSTRFGGKVKKPFANLNGRAVFLRTIERFVNHPQVCQIILAVGPDDIEMVKTKYGPNLGFMSVKLVQGGPMRYQTIAAALQAVTDQAELIAVHDAVRPCLTQETISRVFDAAEKHGSAILAQPVNATVKKSSDGKIITQTLDRNNLYLAQTPQVFKRQTIIDAYNKLPAEIDDITDDAQVVELAGSKVSIVQNDATNIKITTQQDLKLAGAILKILPKPKPKDGPVGPWAAEQGW